VEISVEYFDLTAKSRQWQAMVIHVHAYRQSSAVMCIQI